MSTIAKKYILYGDLGTVFAKERRDLHGHDNDPTGHEMMGSNKCQLHNFPHELGTKLEP